MPKCKATTKKKKHCRKSANQSGFCHIHQIGKVREQVFKEVIPMYVAYTERFIKKCISKFSNVMRVSTMIGHMTWLSARMIYSLLIRHKKDYSSLVKTATSKSEMFINDESVSSARELMLLIKSMYDMNVELMEFYKPFLELSDNMVVATRTYHAKIR